MASDFSRQDKSFDCQSIASVRGTIAGTVVATERLSRKLWSRILGEKGRVTGSRQEARRDLS